MTSPTTSINVSSVSNSGNNSIDALLGGEKWGGGIGTPASLSYSFPWFDIKTAVFAGYSGQPYSTLNENSASQHFGFNSTQVIAAINALNAWANIANIKLTKVIESDTNVGDIRFAFTSASDTTSTGETAWGWANYPNSYWPSAGDIWVSTASSSSQDDDWSIGSFNFYSLIHEIGHALGLKHPFEDTPRLSSNLDSQLYTVMSYTDAPKSLFVKVTSNPDGSASYSSFNVAPETPMLLDIAIMQYLYGANNSYKTGNDIYTFDPKTPFFKTIWDAGGIDTISVANFTDSCEINLNAGSFSKITIKSDSIAGFNWTTPPPTPTYDGTNNLCIAYFADIENAVGGSGNDILTGNSSDNSLDGGAGSDVLYGGDGNDTFDWDSTKRAGNDTFYGGKGNDAFVLSSLSDAVVEYLNEGNDTIWVDFSYSIENLPNVENIFGYGVSSLTLNGNTSSNFFKGGSGNDTIDGGSGTDLIFYSGNFSDYTITYFENSYTVKTKTEGSDTIRNIEFLNFADKKYDLSTFLTPTYSLTATKTNYDEGSSAVFNLVTTSVNAGTLLTYTVSGLTASDLVSGVLTGTTVVGSDGKSSITIALSADNLTEGTESITVSILGNSASTTINDTSINKVSAMTISNTWTTMLGSSAYNADARISIGPDGSIYISGSRLGTNSDADTYLTKYNTSGQKIWTKSSVTTNNELGSYIAVGSDGSIYLTGGVDGAFGGVTSNGSYDAYISKYNSEGTLVWNKLFGTSTGDFSSGITTSTDGSVYIFGITLGSPDGQVNKGGDTDGFLVKYSADGAKLWTRLFGTNQTDFPLAAKTGSDGSIYIAGTTTGSLGGIINGPTDAFLTKYNSVGTVIWTKQFGSSGSDSAAGITIGSDGSVYVTGFTKGSIDGLTYSGENDVFISKYTQDGAKSWTKLLGTSGEDRALSISTGIDGSVYLTGITAGSLDGKINKGDTAGFLAKYSTDGAKIWVELIDTSSEDNALSVATSTDGSIYVTGYTEGQLNGQKVTGSDIYITKFQELSSTQNITGTVNNDLLTGTAGNNSINGGGGIDTLVVSAGIRNYSVTKTATGYTLIDKIGTDGVDTLVSVEAIKFSDKTINLTVQAKAASAPQADVTRLVELYTAFFNRVPDADGMSFWIDEMKVGKTTNQVAEAFYNAGVNYSSLTGFSSTMKNADFINVIYKNVLGRKDGADAGGLSFWEGEITSGRATRGTLVTNILDSAHTFKGDKTWGWVADLLDNKITVAKKFSIDMGLNYNTPEESITKGMAIASAITATDTTAAVTLIGVSEASLLLV